MDQRVVSTMKELLFIIPADLVIVCPINYLLVDAFQITSSIDLTFDIGCDLFLARTKSCTSLPNLFVYPFLLLLFCDISYSCIDGGWMRQAALEERVY
jgi:hypothetical protein